MSSVAIRFTDVSKRYTLSTSRPRSWQETLLSIFMRPQHPVHTTNTDFWVLKDLNFEIHTGETFALIGDNGAGKSTLLKLLAQIVRPTRGTIEINGRVSALLELGTGFHPDLTGRENIYLSANLAGLARSEIERNLDDIIEFANINQFIDVPVRHYSSGMFVRLGFALATHINPDILIVDEVLAVGDAAFQKKCYEKILDIRNQGACVLFVSHSMDSVRQLSDRVLWMRKGVVEALGDPGPIIDAYLADQRAKYEASHEAQLTTDTPEEAKLAEITTVEFLDEHEQPTNIFETGGKGIIRIKYMAHERIDHPVIGLAIYSSDGTHINGPNTALAHLLIHCIDGPGYVDYAMDYIPLLGDTYSVTVCIVEETWTHAFDYQDKAYQFTVKQRLSQEIYGTIYIPSHWNVSPHMKDNVSWQK